MKVKIHNPSLEFTLSVQFQQWQSLEQRYRALKGDPVRDPENPVTFEEILGDTAVEEFFESVHYIGGLPAYGFWRDGGGAPKLLAPCQFIEAEITPGIRRVRVAELPN